MTPPFKNLVFTQDSSQSEVLKNIHFVLTYRHADKFILHSYENGTAITCKTSFASVLDQTYPDSRQNNIYLQT